MTVITTVVILAAPHGLAGSCLPDRGLNLPLGSEGTESETLSRQGIARIIFLDSTYSDIKLHLSLTYFT